LQQLGARYQLLNENVLDLTHVSFIHEGNIGSPEVATTPVEVSQQNGSVRVARYLPKAPPPPVYAGMMGIPGAADREIVTEYYPPALLVSGSEFFEPVAQPRSSSYGAFRVLHAPTPETSRSTHYFWAFSRTFGADDDALTQRFRVFLQEVLDQDKRAIEAQEQAIPEDANSLDDRSAASDVGALKGRHLLEELMQRELVTR
jgi:vanillate O-demethylase monooxygenase subunit